MQAIKEASALRIAHVLLSRGFAGSERSTAESCNEQCKKHEVLLIVRRDHRRKGASVVDRIDPRVKIIEVPKFFFTTRKVKKILNQFQPDVIHCHLRRSTRTVARIKSNAATLSTLHISFNGRHFHAMDGIVCNARWQVEDIPESYKGEIFKANNSLMPHRRLGPSEIKALRDSLGVSDHDFIIAGVGRYHASKAWDTLISAMKRIPQFEHAKLLIFGSGRLEEELRLRAKGDKRIQFLGYRKDIKDLYQVFDLLVCPSRFEPLPRVILEGMDAGVPVLASDIGGCLELIEDYGGRSFKVDDVNDLSETLADCILNPMPKTQIDLSAHYIENANQALEGFYRKLLAKK